MIPKMNGPRVLVQKIDEPALKSSLIEVVSLTDTPSQFAVVLAVGNGALLPTGGRRSLEVNPGDTVVLKQYCGTPIGITLAGDDRPTDCHVVMEDDLLAVLDV